MLKINNFGPLADEYALQAGFGWTNGVLKAFLAEDHDV